jgi:hypothetical protein
LKKLDKYFLSVHAHPNNYARTGQFDGVGYNIPDVIELTFIRRDRLEQYESASLRNPALPHPLDILNARDREPVVLNEHWIDGRTRNIESLFKMKDDEISFLKYKIERVAAEAARALESGIELCLRCGDLSAPQGAKMRSDNQDSLVDYAGGAQYTLSSGYGDFSSSGTIPQAVEREYFFHTQIAANQWILIDLGQERDILRIVVGNRTGGAGNRARLLFASFYVDARKEPICTCRLAGSEEFLIGKAPLVTNFESPVRVRYVRISSPIITALHLRQIQILG